MELALGYGNRTLLMDSGKVVLDVSGEERAALTPQGLVDLFRVRAGHNLSDRTLLSM
jgi:putative ABC transport system ATP-binding protein